MDPRNTRIGGAGGLPSYGTNTTNTRIGPAGQPPRTGGSWMQTPGARSTAMGGGGAASKMPSAHGLNVTQTDAPIPGVQPPAGGTESGPGILEQWFNQRASGTDPAFEYMSKRGMDGVDTRMAAGGSFNSGARGQQLGDFMANLTSQRMGALDNLAGGASGEHQNRLDSMFRTGLGIAGGQAGTAGSYDFAANNSDMDMKKAQLEMFLNKAGVDSAATQGLFNNALSAFALSQGVPGKK